jgi:NAD(P)-dependent dehydrogenase (short-subunit alcohol dehydrogenase family)
VACDVTNRASLEEALEQVTQACGPIDILVNGAGGNQPRATTSPERTFFDLNIQAVEDVFGLNFTGTLLSCQVFGQGMTKRGQGCIVNIASMNSLRPLTRIPVEVRNSSVLSFISQFR